MNRNTKFATGLSILIAFAILLLLSQFNFSALPEPGKMEIFLATKFRSSIIHRASRRSIPPPPSDVKAGLEEGDNLYDAECAACHGLDGHSPTDAGRWMYPRAADLTSSEVQQYSDRELFWIVSNGIRFTGMPAFAQVETNEHIWDLVLYLRTLQRVGPIMRFE
jgi:mono/diheme cytochrome c family protein